MKEEKNKKVVNSKPKSSTSKRTTTAKKSTTVKKEVKKTVTKPAAKKTTTTKKVAKVTPNKKSVETKKVTTKVTPKKVVPKVAPKKTEVKVAPKKVVEPKKETKKVVTKTTPEVKKATKVTVKPKAKTTPVVTAKTKKTDVAPVKKSVSKVIPASKATPKKVALKVAPKKTEVKVAPKKVTEPKKETIVKEEVKVNNITYKKYLYLVAMVLLGFILIIGIWDIASFYNYNRLNTSYLVSTNSINSQNQLKLEDASKTFSKLNGNYFIYISYTDNKGIYNLEKKMKNIIKKYNIENRFYYINVNNIKNDSDYINKVNVYLGLRDAKISQIPTIIYVNKSNEIVYNNIITTSNGKRFDIGDFQKLLDTNGFTAK